MTPGRYLRLRRQAAGVNINDAGIPGVSMLAIERDLRLPAKDEIHALAKAFDFDRVLLMTIGCGLEPRLCRVCACSEWDACASDLLGTGSCHWVEHDLCSACADKAEEIAA